MAGLSSFSSRGRVHPYGNNVFLASDFRKKMKTAVKLRRSVRDFLGRVGALFPEVHRNNQRNLSQARWTKGGHGFSCRSSFDLLHASWSDISHQGEGKRKIQNVERDGGK
jgi:hypothetical protein